jgi:hypothetical protein
MGYGVMKIVRRISAGDELLMDLGSIYPAGNTLEYYL